MSYDKDIIFQLRNLIELRQNTITANKKAMKDYLIEYKKSLELDKKLKKEISTLNTAISLLQYGYPEEDTEEILILENNASNRDEYIYTGDEE